MSVTVSVPTATSIKLRFPEFADTDDAVIEFAIEEAREEVGSNWTKGYNVALVYLVAHYISSAIAATDAGGTGADGDITSESYGRFKISYAKNTNTTGDSAVHGDKSSSSYGRRYVELLGRNFGGPVVI